MESSFNMDDFERSLKEQADKFYMIPSERIWKSLYNDLHPGSKWPSLAVGIILLISLFWVGNPNQNTILPKPANVQQSTETTLPAGNRVETTGEIQKQKPVNQKRPPLSQKTTIGAGILIPAITPALMHRSNSIVPEATILTSEKSEATISEIPETFIAQPSQPIAVNTETPSAAKEIKGHIPQTELNSQMIETGMAQSGEMIYVRPETFNEEKRPVTQLPGETRQNTKGSEGEPQSSQEIESPATITITTTSARKRNAIRKATWTFFISPEISNVHFEGSNLDKPVSGVVVNPSSQHHINTKTRFGFLTGADVNYSIAKNIDFTSGFHLGYTGYNIMAELAHPALATVTFEDAQGNLFTKNYISFYGNEKSDGNLKLSNYSMQFAIPVGLEWTLLDQENVKISVVSTIEPFVVFNSRAYILTGDGRKFVTDPDLMRRLNLNGNFGSYITLSGRKINWKIGPNLRYQVLSTYHNIYPIREHLFNYGIRIGVSKPH